MIPKQKDLEFLAGSASGLEFYDVADITDGYDCSGNTFKKKIYNV